jgi:hypothetical protein
MNMSNSGPQAWAGLGDKLEAIYGVAKILKKKSPMYKKMTLDDVASDIRSLAYHYHRQNVPFVSVRGMVITYFTNEIGEKDVKISIDACLFS